ncbi:MAG: hypothetical protein U9P80_02815 [Thermodesulfobacteriota bacterium]|nr:hypothetical protein [Thermodesulfobacteriota bacterium]
MNRIHNKMWALLSIAVLAIGLAGCGAAQDDHNEDLASQEGNFYNAGESIAPLGCSEDQNIKLFILNEGEFNTLSDGDYVTPGTHTLAVSADDRYDNNGNAMAQRVFISDGGYYQVEAFYDEESGLYVCGDNSYDFYGPDVLMVQPLLIQIIYTADKKAAKAKYVVTTEEDLKPEKHELADRGVGIVLSDEFLTAITPMVNDMMTPMLEEQGISNITIDSLSPADTAGDGVIKAKVGIAGIVSASADIALKDKSNDGIRQLAIGIENLLGLDPLGVFPAIEAFKMPLGFGLEEMIDPLMDSSDTSMLSGLLPIDEGSEMGEMMGSLLGGLAIKSDGALFMNILGLPEYTDAGFATIGASLYPADIRQLDKTDDGKNYKWPEVTLNTLAPYMNVPMLKTSDTDMGIVLSQYNLNQVLSGVMESLVVEIKDVRGIPMIKPAVEGNLLDMEIMINPAGVAIDFSGSSHDVKMVMNDIDVKFIEEAPDGSSRHLTEELSVDICLYIDAGFGYDRDGNTVMTMTILPDLALSHTHVLKDDMGLGVLDHIDLVGIIFGLLSTDGSGGITISLPLSDMGITPREGVFPGWVETDDYGNCFLGMAASGIDMDKLPVDIGSSCFITTAGF